MRSWKDCNTLGKCMIICSVINVIVAIQLATIPSYFSIFSIIMGAYCGMMTYSKKCTKDDKA